MDNFNARNMANATQRVLVIEDELDLQEAMVTYLNLEGFSAHGVGSLMAAQQWLGSNSHDALVMDLGLPDGDGLVWLESQPALRSKAVIITSARGSANERIAGVKAGADTYLVKPIQLEELASHIQNLGRRLQATATVQPVWELVVTSWVLKAPNGKSLKLTHSEKVLLMTLAQLPGKVVSRQDLIVDLGFEPDSYDPRRMEILVRRLRNKAAEALNLPLPLETVHGLGYSFVAVIALR